MNLWIRSQQKEIIKKKITYIKRTDNITSLEINSFTKEYLIKNGIYLIDEKEPIINDKLENYEIKVNREKYSKITENLNDCIKYLEEKLIKKENTNE